MPDKDELDLNKINKEVKLSKHGFTKPQKFFMGLGILFVIAAIIILVFGLIGDYAFIPNNPFKAVSDAMTNAMGFGFTLTWLGVLCLLIGAIIIAITLGYSENVEEREKDKETRKAERVTALREARKEMIIEATATSAVGATTSTSSISAEDANKTTTVIDSTIVTTSTSSETSANISDTSNKEENK